MNIEQLKAHCKLNGLTLNGDYIEFNKDSKDFFITMNFKLSEFLTKNNKDSFTKINLNIILELQELRSSFNSPIRITSSYRSPSYNKSINGATSSEHIKGNALDTQPISKSNTEWFNHVKRHKKTGGVGQYNTFVHIDCGRTRFWKG